MDVTSHTVAVVGNSFIHDDRIIKERVKAHQMLIAVDGGVNHCHRMRLRPDMIVGDLDSLNPQLLEHYPDVMVRRFHEDKNESDLELAIQVIYTPTVEKVTLFAVLEGRTDHLMSNLHLIRRYPQKVFIENEKELIFAFDNSLELPCTPGQTISFIQMGDPVVDVRSEGLKWELQNATFSKYFFSLSNQCLGSSVKVSIGEGDLICCLQKEAFPL